MAVIEIPKDTTNGDIIEALFAHDEWIVQHLKFHMGKKWWWNEPYKGENE